MRSKFEQFGMEDTDWFDMDEVVIDLAVDYTNRDLYRNVIIGDRKSNIFAHSLRGSPANGAYSTVEDLFMFFQKLHNFELLDQNNTALFLKGVIDTGTTGMFSGNYGYGILEQNLNNFHIQTHSGDFSGSSASYTKITAKKSNSEFTIIVLSNYDDPSAIVVREKLLNLICR